MEDPSHKLYTNVCEFHSSQFQFQSRSSVEQNILTENVNGCAQIRNTLKIPKSSRYSRSASCQKVDSSGYRRRSCNPNRGIYLVQPLFSFTWNCCCFFRYLELCLSYSLEVCRRMKYGKNELQAHDKKKLSFTDSSQSFQSVSFSSGRCSFFTSELEA